MVTTEDACVDSRMSAERPSLRVRKIRHISTVTETAADPGERIRRFRLWNIVAAFFHGVSAALMLALANDFAIPVTASYAQGAPGSQATWPAQIVAEPRFAVLTASFLFVSAFFHLLISAPGVFERYAAFLVEGRAPFRWAEYTISSSIMLVPIAMLTGITDVAALVALIGVNMTMIWFGYLQEFPNAPGTRPFWLGSAAGLVPWIAIGIYLIGAGSGTPGFVYAIYISLFAFFNCFGLVMFAHLRGWGRFKDYLAGEKTYIVLSFTAKSALAWQVFSGTLAG